MLFALPNVLYGEDVKKIRKKYGFTQKEMDLPFYDPLLIIEKTEGRMAEDHFWIQIER